MFFKKKKKNNLDKKMVNTLWIQAQATSLLMLEMWVTIKAELEAQNFMKVLLTNTGEISKVSSLRGDQLYDRLLNKYQAQLELIKALKNQGEFEGTQLENVNQIIKDGEKLLETLGTLHKKEEEVYEDYIREKRLN